MKILFFLLVFMGAPAVGADDSIKKPFFDFFRKLIEPPKREVVRPQNVVRAPEKKEVVIPPLQMQIMGISGEEGSRVAIVTYKGSQRLLMEGDEQPGEYKVISIAVDKITLLHIAAGRRQEVTF
jgi:hypothetical protein